MPALDGLRVIDLTRVLGGPYCTQILGDHGADVIKIEPPQGDEVRAWGPPFKDDTASYFIGVNRNKRALALDLARPEGRQVLLRLLEGADVLIENFKPGSMEAWGLGYEDVLKQRFPRLVHARVSGFGATGKWGGMPGYDAIVQAASGMMSVNGMPESGTTRLGIPIVDMATGLSGVIGIMMALYERDRSGQGQYIDLTLYDTAVGLLHPQAANWFLSNKTPGLTGNAHPNISPYDKFHTQTCEIFLGVGNNGQFRKLADALGAPELVEDERFKDNEARNEHRLALTEILEGLLAEQDGHELCDQLLAQGVPAGPVQQIPEVLTHPHTLGREMVKEVDDYRGLGIPIKLSRTPGNVRHKPPHFGEHGHDVLKEAGFAQAEIEDLAKKGILVEQKRSVG